MNHQTKLFANRLLICPLLLALAVWSMAVRAENQPSLNLATAIERTLLQSPQLQQFPYQQRALEAQKLQAGLPPNPQLQADLENVFGSGESRGLSGAELTLSLSQLIEMGDKRQKRIDLVDATSSQLQYEFERQRLDTLSDVTMKYLQGLRIDALLSWNQRRLNIEQQALQIIRHRAEAGAVGQADVLRMQLLLERSESRAQQLTGERQMAYQQLAASWGEEVDFSQLEGQLQQLPALPEQDMLEQAITQSPAFLQSHAFIRLREAQLRLSKAQSRTDITFGAGIRRLEAANDNALVFSFSMPLQIHDRNQGNIAAADAEYAAGVLQQQLTQTELRMALLEIYQAMRHNQQQVERLQKTLIPLTRELLKQTEAGYQSGQYNVLQWVDAQAESFTVERDLIEAQTAVHLQLLELERLTGIPLSRSIFTASYQE
ncbi:TolC family protein [Methylophaga sp.]|uniref:TolC family protein n=1 Tax=Methylophaga sp. TaxID=2024840 RepID=UPI002728B2D4|nr:TolC family protein [Methylophaga sp.]MDO8825112.1 TolC family protein [Methylophaga sp.]